MAVYRAGAGWRLIGPERGLSLWRGHCREDGGCRRRSSDKAELEDDRARAGKRAPWGLGGPRGPGARLKVSLARLHGLRGALIGNFAANDRLLRFPPVHATVFKERLRVRRRTIAERTAIVSKGAGCVKLGE